ncbi:hypothetical protein MSG28_013329 [Choristoneura fumiferana]|uniref:Uncharacterized protein n=1 Tax=Choristoneura fumiferana TaxID=7141 RepID=A0ACC0KTJ3_CHOFU|nr:hypothetical protein MSG28_013329 [Choristoneura fumiferana]
MHSIATLSRSGQFWNSFRAVSRIITQGDVLVRWYAKDPPCDTSKPNPQCRRAHADIKPDVDPNCPVPCETRKSKKKGILHKIKLRVIEGGTNFGTPFRRLKCEKCKPKDEEKEEKKPKNEEPKALPEPKRVVHTMPPSRAGVQVSVLGADTAVGQYVALLLKQCSCIKKLRLYESKDSSCCKRDLCSVVQDLQHINTNCLVQAFSCSACCDLERCLQNTDIVLMLETGDVRSNMSSEKRFHTQAPIVKRYADVIANECPKAFIIVCTTPIDCMVPLIAEMISKDTFGKQEKFDDGIQKEP